MGTLPIPSGIISTQHQGWQSQDSRPSAWGDTSVPAAPGLHDKRHWNRSRLWTSFLEAADRSSSRKLTEYEREPCLLLSALILPCSCNFWIRMRFVRLCMQPKNFLDPPSVLFSSFKAKIDRTKSNPVDIPFDTEAAISFVSTDNGVVLSQSPRSFGRRLHIQQLLDLPMHVHHMEAM